MVNVSSIGAYRLGCGGAARFRANGGLADGRRADPRRDEKGRAAPGPSATGRTCEETQ